MFKENLEIQLITTAEQTKQKSNIVKKIKRYEDKTPAVSESEKKRLCEIIYSQADRLYAHHSTITGIGISNVRCIKDDIIQEPCIVIYCSDKSIIPFGEKPIPNMINGCNCDIRENVILFGSCDDCGEENANPGCGIGMTFSNGFGSAGFLANSTRTDETGFLTAAHVVVRNLEKLYVANVFLSLCNGGDESNVIVHPSVYHANRNGLQSRCTGEVRNSYLGNYQLAGVDAAFVRNYKPTIRGKFLSTTTAG